MLASSVSTCRREIGSLIPSSQWSVGVLWSAVATMDEMRHALRPASLQALEGLRAGHFVHQVTVDIKQGRAISFLMDDMVLPEFVVKCLRHGTLQIGRKALNYGTGSAVFASLAALTAPRRKSPWGATASRTQRQTSQKPPTAKNEASV